MDIHTYMVCMCVCVLNQHHRCVFIMQYTEKLYPVKDVYFACDIERRRSMLLIVDIDQLFK